MSVAIDFYSHKLKDLEIALKRAGKVLSYLYLARLLSFLAFAACLVFYLKSDFLTIFLVLAILMLGIFLWMLKLDFSWSYQNKFLKHQQTLLSLELDFLDYRFDSQPTGEEYQSLNPHLAADFELFGTGSLFQYINRCSTRIGQGRLAKSLCSSHHTIPVILQKQAAIRELIGKQRFMSDFRTFGSFVCEQGGELSGLHDWAQEPEQGFIRMSWISGGMMGLTFLWLMLVIFSALPAASFIVPMMLSLTIVGFYNRRIAQAHARLGKSAKTFEKYTELIKLIENESFTSEYLIRQQQGLKAGKESASVILRSLFKLLNRFDIRYNVIVAFILNALLLFDIRVLLGLIYWKKKHHSKLYDWFSSLAEMDMMISYAIYAFNNQEDTVNAVCSEDDFTFQADNLGHPLIPPTHRVSNSLIFNGKPAVLIITGANMAGKSTFLRTISVNLILAMNGAPVCAKGLIFKRMDILSSIRIQDSLARKESYFYAELLRLKEVLHHVEHQPASLVILDEILRGTNTKDKQLGTLGLLEKLISLRSVVIIATHDLVIGELEKKYPQYVMNHCFEVELTNDQLEFDYKLKSGISQKLNASVLLRKMEII